MRRVKRILQEGDTRQRTAFLWLPLTVRRGMTLETRWLEKATWLEKVIIAHSLDSSTYWKAVEFIDEEVEWRI